MLKRPFSLLLLTLFLSLLIACGSETLPLPQDARAAVPPTLAPTAAPPEVTTPVSDPADGTARAFYRAWETGDFLGMYSLLTPSSQVLVGGEAFVQRHVEAQTTAGVQQVTTQLLGLNQQNDVAELSVRVTWQTAVLGDISRDHNVTMRFEQNRWGVEWHEGLILPELEGGNRLVMQHRVPARANIYDVNGRALAYQGNAISLGVIPGQIEDEEALLSLLSELFSQPPEEIKAQYEDYLPDWYAPIGDISEETMQAYSLDIQPFIGRGLAPPESRPGRIYAENGVAPHIVGYMGAIPPEQLGAYQLEGYQGEERVGLAGLESWGESYLSGQRGGTLTVVDSNGQYVTTVEEVAPQQARSVYTTLDLEFQAAVERALADGLAPLGTEGAVVVLEVNTGKVLAMASYPSYDPTIFDAARPEANQLLSAVLNDERRPLLNRAAQGAYPAGSVFKLVTFTAGINSGQFTPDTGYNSTGTWSRLGENFIKRDWRDGGHGFVSLRTAIIVSCNSCFYEVGYVLDGVDSSFLPQTATAFGFGQPTGIEGIAEASGTVPSPTWKIETIGEGWVTGDAVNMSIGQGAVQVTPLQIANMFAAIANGGTLYQPTLIDRIGGGGGAPEEAWPSSVNGQIPLAPEQLAVLRGSLYEVANNLNIGTAAFQFEGLPIQTAGKTGTAEDPPRNSHAWYGGYAPADNPEIAVAVIAENAGEGSAVAAPIFRRVVELYYGVTPLRPYPWQ